MWKRSAADGSNGDAFLGSVGREIDFQCNGVMCGCSSWLHSAACVCVLGEAGFGLFTQTNGGEWGDVAYFQCVCRESDTKEMLFTRAIVGRVITADT